MRALELAGQEAPPPVVLKPEVPGRWDWVGTTGVQFIARGAPPARDGDHRGGPRRHAGARRRTHGQALRLQLLDGAPAPRSATGTPGANDALEPGAKLELRFNQPVDEAEVARAVDLHGRTRQGRADADPVRRPLPRPEEPRSSSS